jgi:hypothetical protein
MTKVSGGGNSGVKGTDYEITYYERLQIANRALRMERYWRERCAELESQLCARSSSPASAP